MQFNLSIDQIQTASVHELQKVVKDLNEAILSLQLHLERFPDETPEVKQEFNFQILRHTTMRKAINILLAERAFALLRSQKAIYAA